MWLFCLGKFGRLAEGRDKSKIFVAIATLAAYTKVKAASSHS
jgi:hypothetical protein